MRLSERELERNRQRTLVGGIFDLKRSQDDLARSREQFNDAVLLLQDDE